MATDSNHLLGLTLDSCTLQSLIGRGGMGAVYLAQQSRPRRTVAVKVLLPGLLLEPKIQAEFLTRFRREADAIAALDHIHIMPIYAYGEQDELAFLVMPYVTGGTLRTLLEKQKVLSLSETLSIIEQAAAGLDYAHARGIIHRDLKPGNILFHADGRVLLADFGLAKILHETNEAELEMSSILTSIGTVIGTPEYFSPEQSTGNPVDRRTDIYSLGIIVYQMLGGRVPFTGATPVAIAVKHTIENPPSLSQLNPAIPPSVEAVILKAIAKKPEQRYASAGEFVLALRNAIADTAATDQPDLMKNEFGEVLVPVSLANNDTLWEIPDYSDSEAPTMRTPQTPAPAPVHPSISVSEEYKVSALSSPIKEHTEKRRGYLSTWVAILGTTLAVLLLLGGGITFLYLSSFHPSGNSSSGQINSSVNHETATANSAATAQPVGKLPQALIPVGSRLYGTTLPACDMNKALWTNGANVQVACSSSGAQISDTSSKYLAGTFLNKLPNGYGIPDDYVLQVQVEQSSTSNGGFGVFLRNQPGSATQGAFSFLLFPQGQWSANVYNDTTGVRTTLVHRQTTIPVQGLMTIDIVVQSSNFTFYLNGQEQGYANSPQYPSGTIGLAADSGSDVIFKNLAIYRLP